MSRPLDSSVAAAFASSYLRPFFLFEAVFANETIDLWDGAADLSWNGKTWLGNGWFQGFRPVSEKIGIQADGIEVTLSGIPQALISLALNSSRHTGRGSLWVGTFSDTWTIQGTPALVFDGCFDTAEIRDSDTDSELTLVYESDLVILQKTKTLLVTDAAQKSLDSADKGMEFIAGLQDWTGFWGNKTKAKK